MSEAPGDGDTTYVLLVDDGEDFLRAAAEFLCRPGLVVETASGIDTIPPLTHLQPEVILIGLDMPGLRGPEAISRLRATFPAAGIIALTLSDRHAYRTAALAAGAGEVICKADLVTELLPAIQRVRRAHHAPPVAA